MPYDYEDYTVGWICALPRELAAATAMLDEHHQALPSRKNDGNTYSFGRVGVHLVVIACLPSGTTGVSSAAVVASRMKTSFRSLRIGLMVGIGGGIPSPEHDIRLGDVVISKPTKTSGGVIQYDFGRTIGQGEFQHSGSLDRPPEVLLGAVAKLETMHMLDDNEIERFLSEAGKRWPKKFKDFSSPGLSHDLLFAADYEHERNQPTCERCDRNRLVERSARAGNLPVIHYGTIASGNQVMRHGPTRDRLGQQHGALCFEMEAAGLMNNFPCLVIRGICDYADSHKNDVWQPYAAIVAAACAKELLYGIPAEEVQETRRVSEDYNQSSTQRPSQYHRPAYHEHQISSHRASPEVFQMREQFFAHRSGPHGPTSRSQTWQSSPSPNSRSSSAPVHTPAQTRQWIEHVGESSRDLSPLRRIQSSFEARTTRKDPQSLSGQRFGARGLEPQWEDQESSANAEDMGTGPSGTWTPPLQRLAQQATSSLFKFKSAARKVILENRTLAAWNNTVAEGRQRRSGVNSDYLTGDNDNPELI